MKKSIKYTLLFLFLFIIGIKGIKAATVVAKCDYNYEYRGGKYKLSYSVDTDNKVTGSTSIGVDGNRSTITFSTEDEFSKKLYSNGKVSATCPKLYVIDSISYNVVEIRTDNFSDSDGNSSVVLSGKITISEGYKQEESKAKKYCDNRIKKLRNESFSVKVSFYLDDEGNRKFSVVKSTDGIGGEASPEGVVTIGQYNFYVDSTDLGTFYSESCSNSAMYFDLKGTTTNETITTKKPGDADNGNTDIIGAGDDDGLDDIIIDKPDKNYREGCEMFGQKTLSMLQWAFKVIQFGVPILIIMFGIMDFLKALTSGDDKAFQEAGKKFIKRLIAGLLFIFVPYILDFLFTISGIKDIYGIEQIFCII